MADLRYTVALCMWLTAYSTVSGQFFNASIDNVVIPLNVSSVTVSCPVATVVEEIQSMIQWFNAMDNSMMVATGPDYTIDTPGSYYCQVTESRGVYRSNTFAVYRTGFADNFSIHPKNFTLYSDTLRVAFECRIDTFVAVEEDTSRIRIIWEGSNGSNDSFAELSSNSIFAPLPGYSIFVMDNNLEILPVMVRCRAVFIPAMGDNMTVATSDIAYIMSTEGSGDFPDNRTFLLTPSDEVVTEMDTAAFVCIPANASLQTMWSNHPNSDSGTNNFYLTITNVIENATVMCTVDVETVDASLVVQEVPVLLVDTILPKVTPVIEGGDVTLQCIPVMTYPPPSITWLVNGVVDAQDSTQNFTISPVDDSVIYQCLVEAVFIPTTNKAGPPLSTSVITTTLVECVPNFMVEVTGATDNGDGVYDVMLGDNFTITCMLSCPTNANVTWSQNDIVISSSEVMMPSSLSVTYIRNNNGEIMESVLMRNMAELSDSGTYHCGTTVQTIQSNATADIFVYIVPEITQGPDTAARRLDEDVMFSCTATGVPLPDITWSGPDMTDIPVQPSDDMVIDDTRQSEITVSGLQIDDFGTYTCTATNEFGSVSATALLECIPVVMVNVTGATDINNDGRYDVMLGDSFTIACMLDCPTNAIVTWSQNDNVISSSEMMMMPEGFLIEYQNNNDGEIVGSTLIRNMAALNDSATYQCSTTVQTTQSNATADIFVYITPEITQGPVTAARGLEGIVTFNCTAIGIPLPTITWSGPNMTDIPVQSNDDMIINDTRQSQITVSDLQIGNFGTYTCTATNDFDSVSETALLECIPVVMVSVTGGTDDNDDDIYDVMLGDNFTITCTLDCPTDATLTWSQNDTVISSSEMMMMPESFLIEYQNNDNGEIVGSTLTRNMAALNDSATYQCGTTVQTAQPNDMATIAVYIVAMVTQGPVDMPSKVGESVNFTCNATGVPLPNITWSRNTSGVIIEQPGDIVITDTIVGITRQSELMLTNLKDSDFQYYTCSATNRFGSDDVTALLGMEVVITEAPMETTQLVGRNVTFRCIATGIPLPNITWSSDNREVINPSSETQLDNITIFSEIIINVGMDDFVNYTCSAMNRFNMVNESAALINATIPMITVRPRPAIVLLGDNVTFTCVAIGVPAPIIEWSNVN